MSVVKMKDGITETILDRWDLLKTVEIYMGYEAMRLLEDYFDQYDEIISDLEQQIEDLKNKQDEPDERDV